jgi:hypothetical protein
MQASKSKELVPLICQKILKWLGLVIRMNQTRVAMRIFERRPEGRRKMGRTKLRLSPFAYLASCCVRHFRLTPTTYLFNK